MKLLFWLLLALASVTNAQVEYATQQFFIPMPEKQLFDLTFEKINSDAAGWVNTMISLTISIDDTVVIYDHWEDGYEPKASKTQSWTEVWGDGDADNGCAPDIQDCTDANDKLKAGQAIIIEDRMSPNRSTSVKAFDGGDRIMATKPVAVTRGAFPDTPGSLMAGAIEVMDTFDWGTAFEAPVGTNSDITTNAFQYVALYVQASADGTDIRLNGNKVATLNMGQTHVILNVLQGWKVTTSKPAQVDLITGDIGSTYELRWFALLPTAQWSNSYVSPVGDDKGDSRLVFYNPNSSTLTITYKTLFYTKTVNVAPGKSVLSDVIPDFSGCFVDGPSKFIVLALTDTVSSGQIYDWGFPVMPRDKLTPQVLIGLGFGCTNNDCNGGTERSVVWITPVEDADLYLDFNNDGVVDKKIKAGGLTSHRITDTYENDHDMSGALIFATAMDSGETGPPVDIAAAWGQNPDFSGSNDYQALDLGTVVLPFDPLRITQHCTVIDDVDGDGKASAGDKVELMTKVMNVGQNDLPTGYWAASPPDMSQMDYIPGSTKCKDQSTGSVYNIPDNGQAVPNLNSQAPLKRRGGTHDFTFMATIDSGANLPPGFCEVVIQGELTTSVQVTPTFAPTASPTKAPTKSPTGAPTVCPVPPNRKILIMPPREVSPTASPTAALPTWSPETARPTDQVVTNQQPPDLTKAPTPSGGELCECGYKGDAFDGGGFVTGGGWIYLGPTAIWTGHTLGSADSDRRANFGFNAKFKGTTPGGSTNFVFEGGSNFHFHSDTGNTPYTFLEVPNEIQARWKGTGTLATADGPKQGGYSFLVAVQDFGEPGAEDTWRLRIWETANPSNVIFDTNPEVSWNDDSASDRFKGTTLGEIGPNGGGNIQLHKKGSSKPPILPPGKKCNCKNTPAQGDGNGFVTGGGWIYTNEAVWRNDAGVEIDIPYGSRANFGFNAKFQGGVPRGSTNFVFEGGSNFHFHSETGNTPYEFLEVPSETEARWTGVGTVATVANPKNKDFKEGYSFMVAVQDLGEPGAFDTWRIRIWKTDTGVVVFDTNPDEALLGAMRFEGTQLGEESSNGGGNVQIHWKGPK